ncbi:MAG: CpXC domain-containing protein [Chloroflexota bacterium]
MTTIKTQVNCPNCKQPVAADIEQLFDVGSEPAAKQRFLSGAFNQIQCPSCGYNGSFATPLVYHDPDKELLLTFFPPELNVTLNDQEKALGRFINQVVDNIPQEQRKGYIFNPQSTLTLQGLMERVLHEDGITKEMIEDQQKRVRLIQRLMELSEDALPEVAKQEDELIDAQFFSLLNQLIQSTAATGDQANGQVLRQLQENLIPITTFGKEIQEQSKEVDVAVKALQAAGEKLTRENLLDIVIEHSSDAQLNAIVSLARPGLDYEFFTLLTAKIEAAKDGEVEKLSAIRDTLLEMTKQLDKQMDERISIAQQYLAALLEVENIPETVRQNLPALDDFFLQVLNNEYETALQAEDSDKLAKLQQVIDVIQTMVAPGGALLQDLLKAPDEESVDKMLAEHKDQVNSEFVESLTSILVQLEAGEDQEKTEQVRKIYRKAVRISMQTSMKAS